jgi:hypothetical protein
MISMLKTKLLPNYEVIVVPGGLGLDIVTEGMIKLTIDSSTNFDELFEKLTEITNFKSTADELKIIGEGIARNYAEQVLGVPNKNGDRYPIGDVSFGNIPHTGPEVRLAPRGIIGDDGKLKITSMDYVVDKDTELGLVKSRHHETRLFDPFASLKKEV